MAQFEWQRMVLPQVLARSGASARSAQGTPHLRPHHDRQPVTLPTIEEPGLPASPVIHRPPAQVTAVLHGRETLR
jgi:hypothetical protein